MTGAKDGIIGSDSREKIKQFNDGRTFGRDSTSTDILIDYQTVGSLPEPCRAGLNKNNSNRLLLPPWS